MYELRVEREFCAAHALSLRGERETLHGHNFHVTITIAGPELDADGLLIDFHQLERVIDGVLAPLHNANLNSVPPFDRVNPSAEHIARHIGVEVARGLAGIVPAGAPTPRLEACSVTEAPGCTATYRTPATAPKERASTAR